LGANVTDASRPLILVIDDDEPTRDALLISLEAYGYRAVGTDDGAAAIKTLHADRPAAIVLDLYMPGMDGFEVMSALKSAALDVPVIAISGGMPGRPGDLLPLALDFGAAAALRKPFPIEDLDAAIRKVVRPRA
jgi:two-component system response regulator PrrA